MKKIMALIICLSLFLMFPQEIFATETPPDESELYAKAAVLLDGESGRVLYSKNGTEELANASTTKILTCIIALENCSLDQIVEISLVAAKAPKVHLGVKEGQRFVMKDLLYAMMLESFNDCAVAIAEHIAGTTEAFSKLMNEYAKKIGCENTFFLTPNGLDAKNETNFHHTTAQDLAQIMRYCIKLSPQAAMFLKITGEKEHQFMDLDGVQQYTCFNHNAFLQMMDGAISGKTGFTGNAGYCYVGALEQNGKTYIVALLACGWPNNKTYKWADTKKLMQYGIASFEKKRLDDVELEEEKWQPIFVFHGQGQQIFEKTYVPVRLRKVYDTSAVLLSEGEQVEVEYDIAQTLDAPVKKGDVVGHISLRLGDMILREYVVETAEEVKKIDYGWCLKQLLYLMF